MSNKIMLGAVVVVGALAFFGGMKYGQANARGNFQANIAGGFRTGVTGRAPGANADFINGDIIAKDNQSITIKMRDGNSKIILYSSSTEVSKFDAGTANDLLVGKTISITGTANTDGSLTAKTIQVRPPMPSPSPTPIK